MPAAGLSLSALIIIEYLAGRMRDLNTRDWTNLRIGPL